MHIHIKTNTFSHSSYRHLPQGLRMLKRLDLRKDINLGGWLIERGYPSLAKMLQRKETNGLNKPL